MSLGAKPQLRDRLEQAILFAGRTNGSVALLLIDLDQFKEVNDSAGHRAGDNLLQLVSLRLQGSVRSSDTVARVEDRSSWDLPAGLGCEMAQGYYISRPLPSDDIPSWVQHWSGPAAD